MYDWTEKYWKEVLYRGPFPPHIPVTLFKVSTPLQGTCKYPSGPSLFSLQVQNWNQLLNWECYTKLHNWVTTTMYMLEMIERLLVWSPAWGYGTTFSNLHPLQLWKSCHVSCSVKLLGQSWHWEVPCVEPSLGVWGQIFKITPPTTMKILSCVKLC